jgi:hypothetical protein
MGGRGFLVFSEDTNKTEHGIHDVTWLGVLRALKRVKLTAKVTSYSTRFACVPLHWCGDK